MISMPGAGLSIKASLQMAEISRTVRRIMKSVLNALLKLFGARAVGLDAGRAEICRT